MYLTLFFDQNEYDFNIRLHATQELAEIAFEGLLRQSIVPEGTPMPPKECWPDLFDEKTGEPPQIYEINADGGPPIDIKDKFYQDYMPEYDVALGEGATQQ